MLEPKPEFAEDRLDVGEGLMRLRGDRPGNDLAVRSHRHLAGDEDEIAGTDGLGERQRTTARSGWVGAEAFDGHAGLSS